MQFNYHTHTKRCGHARGEDREYVEKAIANGVKTLGFADHAPYIFRDGQSAPHRIPQDMLFEYADSVRTLAKEYANDIRILLGFELEYYPQHHEREKEFLSQVSPDYFILGQHFLDADYIGPYMQNVQGEALLNAYITQVIEGLATGDFLYLAHPDLPGWNAPEEVALREYTRLCKYAKEKDIPLEVNLLGLAGGRCYPSRKFFEIASKLGNRVILGVDAHDPYSFDDKSLEERALRFCEELRLNVINKPLL